MADLPIDPAAAAFYRRLLQVLRARGVPFLVGGAWGLSQFTGVQRPTKDLDVFVVRDDWDALQAAASAEGWRCELAFAHWLGKVHHPDGPFADVIFNSGNGLSPVERDWFDHAPQAQLLGETVQLLAAEECLWTKAFIMERERFDGADVVHLLRARGRQLDWPRLLARFGPHWRVLLAHLVLFGFVYPADRALVPRWVMDTLTDRLREETQAAPPRSAACAGTLLSREQYLPDLTHHGLDDARLAPEGTMSPDDVAAWTAAIPAPAAAGRTRRSRRPRRRPPR